MAKERERKTSTQEKLKKFSVSFLIFKKNNQ